MKEKILAKMVDQFYERHGRAPLKIVVSPLALVALGLRNGVKTFCHGVQVECRAFKDEEVLIKTNHVKARYLGIFLKEKKGRMTMAACDLKSDQS
jgi:hypothetical protein